MFFNVLYFVVLKLSWYFFHEMSENNVCKELYILTLITYS